MESLSNKLFDKLDTHRLPSLDQVLIEIISACSQKEVTFDRLAEIINTDPALTVKVLTIVNSPAYSPLQPLATLERALITLGIETIKTLAITASVRQVFNGFTVGKNFNKKQYWRRSLQCGLMVKELASLTGYSKSDEAYLAGLLHNIAILANKLEGAHHEELRSVSLSASIGISVFPSDGDTEESLIECADSAMYKVKKQHKNGYHFFSRYEALPSMPQEEKKLELVDALVFSQFIVFYQPLFDSEYEQVVGLEALLRWHHPEKGLIFPAEFLPEARLSGLMPAIDEWVFNRVRADFADMLGNGSGGIKLFLNVSVEKFSLPDFSNWLSSVVSDNRSFAKNLHIEIPSEVLSGVDEAFIEKLGRVHKLGVKIIIDIDEGDDLSLASLYDRSIYGIKIDSARLEESMRLGLNDDSQGFKGSAKQKGIRLIAKNVDSERNLRRLQSMEFDLVQGFLYYHPLPLQTAKLLIESTNRGK